MQARKQVPIFLKVFGWAMVVFWSAPALLRMSRIFAPKEPQNISTSCRQAIIQGEAQIDTLPNVQLKVGKWEHIDFVYAAPAARPRKYQYILEDTSGMRNLFNSPRLLSRMSQDIIRDCPEVGMVGFSNARYSASRNYGLYPNQEVQEVCFPDPASILNPFNGGKWSHESCD